MTSTSFGSSAFILEAQDLPTGYYWLNKLPSTNAKLIEATYNSLGHFHAIVGGSKDDIRTIQKSILSGGALSELTHTFFIEALHPDVLQAYFALLKTAPLKYTAFFQFESVCRAFEVAQKIAEHKDLKLIDFRGCKGNSYRPHLVVTSDKPESEKVITALSDGDTVSTARWLGEISPLVKNYIK